MAITQSGVFGNGINRLVHGQRFAGQRRLVHAQLLHRDQAQVRRYAITGRQQHTVTGYQLAGIDLSPAAAANYRGVGRQHCANGDQRGFGLAFLDKAYDGIDHHRAQQHAGIDPVTERSGDHCAGEHHVEQDVVKLRQQAHQGAASLRRRQAVFTVYAAPCYGLRFAQACRSRLQALLDLNRLHCVPGRLVLCAGFGV